MPPPALVGTAEIAAMLGVSRQRVLQLAAGTGFPTPAILSTGKVWLLSEFEEWAARENRTLTTP